MIPVLSDSVDTSGENDSDDNDGGEHGNNANSDSDVQDTSASIGAVAAAVGVQDGSDDEIDDDATTPSSKVRVPSVDASYERLSSLSDIDPLAHSDCYGIDLYLAAKRQIALS